MESFNREKPSIYAKEVGTCLQNLPTTLLCLIQILCIEEECVSEVPTYIATPKRGNELLNKQS
jgi:hypothetical protein